MPSRHLPVQGMINNWDFVANPVSYRLRKHYIKLFLTGMHKKPASSELKPAYARPRWIVYFIYCPTCELSAAHYFTLSRLRDSGISLLIVCATKSPAEIPGDVHKFADALIWKTLSGFDFSAYSLGLWAIAKRSPHSDVFVLNDSVFGPFSELTGEFANLPWDLTGFTASCEESNHLQSYAFFMRDVCTRTMSRLSTVFFPLFALNNFSDVVTLQELRFARVAARQMKVGAFWFEEDKHVNPVLVKPFELIDAGFPFLKRALLGKNAEFQQVDEVRTKLRELNHPVDIAQV
jgi:lipopolysaccharide biosynthesis protein